MKKREKGRERRREIERNYYFIGQNNIKFLSNLTKCIIMSPDFVSGVKIQDLGIELIDVRIKKVELPDNVSNNVYRRMATERQTVAREFRSRGEEQAKQIRANADRQREEILAEAYRKSEQIRGEGDAIAAKTYADAYNQDRDFYAFTRSLRAYESSFGDNQDVILLSPDSDFFKFFKDSESQQ